MAAELPAVGALAAPAPAPNVLSMHFRVLKVLQKRGADLEIGTIWGGNHPRHPDYADDYYAPRDKDEDEDVGVSDGDTDTRAGAGSGAATDPSQVAAAETATHTTNASRQEAAIDDLRHLVLTSVVKRSAYVEAVRGPTFPQRFSLPGYGTIDLASDAGLDALRGLCEVAPFGDLRDQSTRVDPAVRDALRVDARGMRTVPSHSGADGKITLDYSLYGAGGLRWSAARINVYEVGGHFGRHVDTPSGPDHIATVVFTLNPGGWEGGLLRLHGVDGTCREWDGKILRSKTGTGPSSGGAGGAGAGAASSVFPKPGAKSADDGHYDAPGIIFYSDCVHEITPVTAGVRVTLTVPVVQASVVRRPGWHTVHTDRTLKNLMCDADIERGCACVKDLIAAMAGRPAALLLQHGYTSGNLDATMLKGVDRSLAHIVATVTGRAPVLRAVIVTIEAESDYENNRDKPTVKVYAIDPRLMETTASAAAAELMLDSSEGPAGLGRSASDCDDAGASATTTPTASAGSTHSSTLFVDLMKSVVAPHDSVVLKETLIPYIGYTGNEAQPMELHGEYLRAAIMLQEVEPALDKPVVPPLGVRMAGATSAPKGVRHKGGP